MSSDTDDFLYTSLVCVSFSHSPWLCPL